MAANESQIAWLKNIPEYAVWYKVMGAFDPKKDYTGPEGNWKAKLIPQTVWWIDIGVASFIHDAMYVLGNNEKDRWSADASYMVNIMLQIEMCGRNRVHRNLARGRAWKYFAAVRENGKEPFKKAKPGGWPE